MLVDAGARPRSCDSRSAAARFSPVPAQSEQRGGKSEANAGLPATVTAANLLGVTMTLTQHPRAAAIHADEFIELGRFILAAVVRLLSTPSFGAGHHRQAAERQWYFSINFAAGFVQNADASTDVLALNLTRLSRKSQDSFVHPGVSSFG
jgi:hypothetical protein